MTVDSVYNSFFSESPPFNYTAAFKRSHI